MEALLVLVITVLWVYQLVAIYRLPESHFKQPTDRVLWFLLVLMLVGVGAAVFLIWNHERTKQVKSEKKHRRHRAHLEMRLKEQPKESSGHAEDDGSASRQEFNGA